MAGINVRQLAAVDMHGTRGTKLRRRVVRAEFITAAVVVVAFGIWLAVSSPGLGGRALGLCVTGCGLNYAPLAAYAIALGRSGALEAELAGVDIGRELRHYSLLQLWILVPLSLVVAAIRNALSRCA